jgi:hypothetical protein
MNDDDLIPFGSILVRFGVAPSVHGNSPIVYFPGLQQTRLYEYEYEYDPDSTFIRSTPCSYSTRTDLLVRYEYSYFNARYDDTRLHEYVCTLVQHVAQTNFGGIIDR